MTKPQLGLNLKKKIHFKQCNHYRRRITLTASVRAMRSFMNLNRLSTRVLGLLPGSLGQILHIFRTFPKNKNIHYYLKKRLINYF